MRIQDAGVGCGRRESRRGIAGDEEGACRILLSAGSAKRKEEEISARSNVL